MKIDKSAETLGRNVVHWVGARDEAKFLSALQFLAREEHFREAATTIYYAVGALALESVYQGQRPSPEQLEEVALAIQERLPWTVVDLVHVSGVLYRMAYPTDGWDITAMEEVSSIFIVSGYLLAWYHEGLGYTDPYEWLDRLLDTLSRMPEAN